MTASRDITQILCLLATSYCLAGCWDDDPCDPGQIFEDLVCKPAPAPPGTGGAPGAGGAPGIDPEPSPDEAPWGAACTTDADCAGDAAFCPPAPFNLCTNIECSAGEANEGICPSGWICLPAGGGLPTSICVPPM